MSFTLREAVLNSHSEKWIFYLNQEAL